MSMNKKQILSEVSSLSVKDRKDIMSTMDRDYCSDCGTALDDNMECPACMDNKAANKKPVSDKDKDGDSMDDSDNDME